MINLATTTNKHKRPQTSSNDSKPPANDLKSQANDHKLPTKSDVLFLLPAPANYKHHIDFEKHMQSVRGNCLLLSYNLYGESKMGSACFGTLSS